MKSFYQYLALKIYNAPMTINFKKLHEDAIAPTKHYDDDMAWDLYNYSKVTVTPRTMKFIKVGIAVECPPHICWTLRSRSSMHINGLWVYNGAGDPGYRGDIGVNIWNTGPRAMIYEAGERIGQIHFMIRPNITLQEVQELEDSPRSVNWIGSSGR